MNGAAVTISGVTGQTAINTWIISNVLRRQQFLVDGHRTGTAALTSSGGTWRRFRLPGSTCRSWPPDRRHGPVAELNSPSPFDSTKFNLVSGGTTTISTPPARALRPSVRYHHGRSCDASPPNGGWNVMESWRQRAGKQLFPNGTTISSIAPDGRGRNYTITMSAAATASGSPGFIGCGGELCIRWFSIHLGDHPRRPAYVDAGKHPREQ